MRLLTGSRSRRAWVIPALLVGVVACASLPPRAPTQSIKSIAGKWEGFSRSPRGYGKTTDWIREDGTNEWTLGKDTGTSTLTESGGVVRWKSSSGYSGTVVLHEGEGKRVLVWTVEGCSNCQAESTPAK